MKNQKYYIAILLCFVLVLTTPLIGLSQSNEPTQEQQTNEQPYPAYPSYSPEQEQKESEPSQKQKANESSQEQKYKDTIQKQTELNNEIEKARSLRNTGILEFVLGASASILSIAFIPYKESNYNSKTGKIDQEEKGSAGAFYGLLIGGTALEILGIVNWVDGGVALNRLESLKTYNISFNPSITPDLKSCGLSMQILF
jgi:hypothetical protein